MLTLGRDVNNFDLPAPQYNLWLNVASANDLASFAVLSCRFTVSNMNSIDSKVAATVYLSDCHGSTSSPMDLDDRSLVSDSVQSDAMV